MLMATVVLTVMLMLMKIVLVRTLGVQMPARPMIQRTRVG